MRVPITLLTVRLLFAIFVFAQAGDDSAVRKQLNANYAAFTKAFQTKDEAALSSLMADDYTADSPEGQAAATKKQVLADLKRQMGGMSDVKWVRTIKTLKLTDTTAEVTVDGHLTGKTAGRDGASHTLELNATSDDTWVQAAGVWKIKHSKVVKFKMLFDGKEAPTR